MLNTTPLSSTIDTTSTTCTALILLPSRQRPARTRSLPARINLPSQALASISEEHSDGHNHNHNDKQGVAELRSRIQRPGAKKSEYLESPNPEPQFKSKSTSGPFLGADSDTTTTIATGSISIEIVGFASTPPSDHPERNVAGRCFVRSIYMTGFTDLRTAARPVRQNVIHKPAQSRSRLL
ncbi:hypothetical protein LENED_001477 [Lentinula edodes]|uniref:Uncharacterized protein n=1 Tax=Lentinula edodes TaxID=5353 RepID=A0A1Q3DYA8_LENED|nr:hypothetical protein LENED_001477 [Lentinula edodes]